MKRKLVVEFAKMNGAGNDFIVLDNRFYNFTDAELSDLAARLCPRRTGIGADGLLAFARPEDPAAHDYRMRYVNADGSPATMCGNGARCLARFARSAGLEKRDLTFESDAGVYRAAVEADPDAPVRLYVPPPRDFEEQLELSSDAARRAGPVSYIWTGTEHTVRFVDDAAAVDLAADGRAVRQDAAVQPAGANFNAVQVLGASGDEATLRVRTYEKGVEGETPACGTGALAAAVAAHLTGRVAAERVAVQMPGGTLRVGFRVEGGTVTDLYLEGPVAQTFRGTVEV